MPIDTLKASKRLQEEGTFSPEQADRIAEILSDLDIASATKEDLDEVETRLSKDLDEVEQRLTQRIELSEERLGKEIQKTRTQLFRWMLASVTGVATIVGALVALLNYLLG